MLETPSKPPRLLSRFHVPLAAGCIVVAMLTALVTSQLATAAGQVAFVFQTSNAGCTYAQSNLTAPSGNLGGLTYNYTRSQYYGSAPCNQFFSRPAGQILVQSELFKFNGSSWVRCNLTGQYSNPSPDTQRAIQIGYGNTSRCGPGQYGNQGYHWVNFGSWRGGALWSGAESIPV